MVIEIPLSKYGKSRGKYVAIVDDCDSDLAEMNWNVLPIPKGGGYARRHLYNKGKNELMHRVVLERMGYELKEGEFPDHINGNGLDNRRENLRIATHSQNMANRRKHRNNKSGYKGVIWSKANGKWRAKIIYLRKSIHLGYFDTPEKAYKAYCEKAIELFGEYANLD